jgi:hypothetical protein
MTKFSGTFSGQTDGGDWKAPVAIGAVVAVGFLAYETAKSAASALGNVLGDVLIAAGTLAVAAVVRYVIVKTRRPRRGPAGGHPAQAVLWQPNPHALPPRETRAIAPAPIVNVNIGSDLLATLLHAAQQQVQAAVVIVPADREELSR